MVAPPPPPPPPVDRNHAYTYQGSTKALPTKLFDDGQSTYFAFGRDDDLPAIFAVDPDGGEAVVNSHMHDGYIVVDRIAPRLRAAPGQRGDQGLQRRLAHPDGQRAGPQAPPEKAVVAPMTDPTIPQTATSAPSSPAANACARR